MFGSSRVWLCVLDSFTACTIAVDLRSSADMAWLPATCVRNTLAQMVVQSPSLCCSTAGGGATSALLLIWILDFILSWCHQLQLTGRQACTLQCCRRQG